MSLKSPDWTTIINDLIYAGISMREIGRTIDASMTADLVRYYRQGTQPTYVRGEALIGLWCLKLGRHRDDLPRVPWIPRRATTRRRQIGGQIVVKT